MAQDHYFSPSPASASRPKRIMARLRGQLWQFDTDAGVFSPDHVDPGSRLLTEALDLRATDRLLELGAGYGPIGLVAAREVAHATLLEINARAAELCRANALLNRVENVTLVEGGEVPAGERYDVVVTNPPYSAGKATVLALLAAGAAALAPGGRFYLVGAKQLGIKSYAKALDELVGPVEFIGRDRGYRVVLALKLAESGDA